MPETSRSSINPFIIQGMIRDPEQFYGRRQTLTEIWGYLRKDANVSIVAERRMGKSSLLAHIARTAAEELRQFGKTVEAHYLDLELVADAEEFFSRVAEFLQMDKTDEVTPRDLERGLEGRRVILCLDEFDRTAYNPAFPSDFFAALRGLSQTGYLTLVVASKTPLVDFTSNGGFTSPFANIFPPQPIVLGPLTDTEARELLTRTARRAEINFDEATLDKAIALTGGHPWRVQLIGWHLVEA
ncbi:MAG: nSTAND1 domain-containing NTPase, partial [Anaerolineales bacterium]